MRKLTLIFVITFALYYAVSYFSSHIPNFDSTSYNVIGTLTLNGKSIYPDPAVSRHPYLPLFLYFEAATQITSSFFHIPQMLIVKIVLTLFHLLSIYAIYILSKKNITLAFLYAVNPISLLITAFHGQFDIIPLTCILFAILTLQNKQFIKTALLLSLAITIKTWPILFVIPFLKRMSYKYYFYVGFLPILSIIFYSFFFNTSILSILRVLLVYQGVGGIWGFGKILSLIFTSKITLFAYKVFFVFGLLFYSFKQKKKVIIEELFELLLLFFIFTPGFGIQWFLWLTPFLFLTKKPFIHLFITAIVLSLCIAYSSWPPFVIFPSHMVDTVLFLVWPLFIIYFFLFFILMKKKYSL